MKKILVSLTLTAMTMAGSAHAQGPSAREQLDGSAGWGTDLATRQIAIDPVLEAYWDPATATLVINPNLAADAAADLGAEVRDDGSWRMSDGSILRPTLADLVIEVGDEEPGLMESAGLPAVPFDAVTVAHVGEAPEGNLNKAACCPQPPPRPTRWRRFYRCSTCTSCFQGCSNFRHYWGMTNFRTCRFTFRFWDRCGEWYQITCSSAQTGQPDCTGPAWNLTHTGRWICAQSC